MDETNENLQAEEDSLDSLRAKYLHKGKNAVGGKRFALTDIFLLCVVIIVSLTTVIWFATPVVELGGNVYRNKTQDIFSFLFGSENSMYNQIVSGIDKIKNIETDAADGIGSVMKLVRAFILTVCACLALIYILIEIISAPIYFFKGKKEKLISVSVKSVINKLNVYIVFVFFGSVSGGTGIDAYYFGYSTGIGMTVGILLSIAILITVFLLKLFDKNTKDAIADKQELKRFIVAGAVYTAIAIAVTFMRLYSVFMYAITSSFTAVAGLAQGFRFEALVFPLLNLLLFASCQTVVNLVSAGFRVSYEYMLNLGCTEKDQGNLKKVKRIRKVQLKNLITIVVISVISWLSAFILKLPEVGFGWSVNIYPQLIAIFALSACGVVVNSIIFKKNKVQKES